MKVITDLLDSPGDLLRIERKKKIIRAIRPHEKIAVSTKHGIIVADTNDYIIEEDDHELDICSQEYIDKEFNLIDVLNNHRS